LERGSHTTKYYSAVILSCNQSSYGLDGSSVGFCHTINGLTATSATNYQAPRTHCLKLSATDLQLACLLSHTYEMVNGRALNVDRASTNDKRALQVDVICHDRQ
jgi:hypothetical protein